MQGPAYPPARQVAPRIHEHFSRRSAELLQRAGEPPATVPDQVDIEELISAAFWSSLRREEGTPPRVSLAFLTPEQSGHPLLFERPLRLLPELLTRVAPGVDRAGIHVGVWRDAGGLAVWGTTREVPRACFVLEVVGPGLLVVKHHRDDGTGKFVNVAVLEGDQVKLVDEHASSLPDCPSLLGSLIGLDAPEASGPVNVLVELAVSMRAHRHGGTLLVVPDGSEGWRESITRPVPYSVSPPFSALAHLATGVPRDLAYSTWRDELSRAVDGIAGLTAVDGATVITATFQLVAFGAKITRRTGWPQVERLSITEPVEDNLARLVDPTELGGTRHLSAAQFVQDQRDALALVASQDGAFTVFAWSPVEDMVHAHRIETLLL
ncbi:MAG: hypothetical protein HOP14_11370 [Acidobacteria bacterium]|nr:hypothetical protein [Acidobacteriota bacterium]